MENTIHNNNLPVVSVIMLAFNHAAWVRQAMESVLNQKTEFLFEILIGDDASSDGTSEIVQEYAERYSGRIISFIRRKNMGATKNLYDLIEHAQGTYLAYLECDDYWSDCTKLQKQVEFLEEHREYIGCTHRIATIDGAGNRIKREFTWISNCEHYTIRDFQGIVLPGHISSLVHRNIFFGTEGTYEGLITLHPVISDRVLGLILASRGDLYQFPQEMSCYRIPEKSGESATAKVYLNNPNEILEEYLFTYRLRKYGKKHHGIHADFSMHVLELLSAAVHDFLEKPGVFRFWVVVRILLMEHDIRLFQHLLRKLFEIMKR